MGRIGQTTRTNRFVVTSDRPFDLYDERGALIFRIDNTGNRYVSSRGRLQKVPRS